MSGWRSWSLLIVLLAGAALGLSGCGRKGKLEPPPGQDSVTNPQGRQTDPGPLKPKRHLPLDVLLN